jgi:hypothetical protein
MTGGISDSGLHGWRKCNKIVKNNHCRIHHDSATAKDGGSAGNAGAFYGEHGWMRQKDALSPYKLTHTQFKQTTLTGKHRNDYFTP